MRSHPYILVSLVIVLVLAVLNLMFVERIPPRDMTATRLALIETRVRFYWQANKRAATDLAELPNLEARDNATTDGWGRPIEYGVQGTSVTLRSFGSDGQPGGEGDAADLVFTFDLARPEGI